MEGDFCVPRDNTANDREDMNETIPALARQTQTTAATAAG